MCVAGTEEGVMEEIQRGKIRANVEGRLFLLRRTAPHRTGFAHFGMPAANPGQLAPDKIRFLQEEFHSLLRFLRDKVAENIICTYSLFILPI